MKKALQRNGYSLGSMCRHISSSMSTRVPDSSERHASLTLPYYYSYHHQRTMTRVLTCMRDGTLQICNNTTRESEIRHLKEIFFKTSTIILAISNWFAVRC